LIQIKAADLPWQTLTTGAACRMLTNIFWGSMQRLLVTTAILLSLTRLPAAAEGKMVVDMSKMLAS
jgi:hypothetical protein